MDSVDDMILLAEVAENGGFTRAGARIGMPKSTVSQRIAQLEERLGLRLLNRSTRQVSLTEAGQVYLDYCRRVRAEVSAAATAMSNLKGQPDGRLRITCPEITASHFMPGFLQGFATEFPRIAVELIATNRPLDIIRERIDFAFRVGDITGQDLVLRRVSRIRRTLVSSPDYLAHNPAPRTPEDLLSHRCLLHDAQPEWLFAAGDDRLSIRPTPAAKSDTMGYLLHAAMAGSGVTLLPAYVCEPAIASGRLVKLLPDWEAPPYSMALVFPNQKNLSRPQAAFRSYAQGFDFSQLAGGSVD
ncbi:LysR substrate-binding domain-containing protein [Arenibacterium sp. LLYu02]|uniref:LysR family transcriptional regulator n=1 Tax=Arenibacterium sp. LLYu02 TaxID=3404132 RepID=UPI003B21A42D